MFQFHQNISYVYPPRIIPVTNFSVRAWDVNFPPQDTETTIWSLQDLNAHHGGKYVYIGMHHEPGQPPVTSIDFLIQSDEGPHTPDDWKSSDVDLNSGAGGMYIYLTWKTGEPRKEPIIGVMFVESWNGSPPVYPGWDVIPKDLCAGASGSFIYAYYQRDTSYY